MPKRFNVRVEVKGLPELKAELRRIPDALRQGALDAGLREAADMVRDEARVNVPTDTYHLLESLNTSKGKRARPGVVNYFVGVGNAFYGAFLEYGTDKMAAHAFLRPALLSRADAAVAAVTERVRRALATNGPVK
jgi:HK97 gp10 family phage protein